MRIGKLLAAIFGALLLLAGAGMTTGGAIALGVSDGDGWVNAPSVRLDTDTAALVGADIDIELGEAIDDRTFVSFEEIPTLIDVDSRNDKEIFVGIARNDDVDEYLAGGTYAVVEFWDDDVEVVHRDGGATLAPPATQDFWVASSETGALEWDLEDGTWSIAVLNADGSERVDVRVDASARIPFIGAIGIGLLVFGVMAVIGGAVMLYFGVRSDPRGRAASPADAAPPTPPAAPAPEEPQEPVIVS